MEKDIYNPENYIGQAINFLKNRQDAEDAVQSALLYFCTIKDKLKENLKPSGVISRILYQECIKIYREKNNIIIGGKGYSKKYGKPIDYDGVSQAQKNIIDSSRVDYNNGQFLYDIKVIQKNPSLAYQYLNIPFEERSSTLTVHNTKGKKKKRYISRDSKHVKYID